MSIKILAAAAVLLAPAAYGQAVTRVRVDSTQRPFQILYASRSASALLGLTATPSSTPSDTLGVLVGKVAPGSAAERAGIAEGARIASINGVNLKLHPSDAGQSDMQGIMASRFQRELAKVRPGDAVTLNVYANNRFSDVKVQTEAPQTSARGKYVVGEDANRASLGAVVGGTPSKRDTLGVFVSEVAENGPLAKAGIYEGSRIASIAGVDLRVAAGSAGNAEAASSQSDRLVAELAKLTPGAAVELRVYDNGRFRNVSVETMRRGDIQMPGGTGAGPYFLRSGNGAIRALLVDSLRGHLELIRPRIDSAMKRVDSVLLHLDRHVLTPERVEMLMPRGFEELRLRGPNGMPELRMLDLLQPGGSRRIIRDDVPLRPTQAGPRRSGAA